jgi:hypothetical protein
MQAKKREGEMISLIHVYPYSHLLDLFKQLVCEIERPFPVIGRKAVVLGASHAAKRRMNHFLS